MQDQHNLGDDMSTFSRTGIAGVLLCFICLTPAARSGDDSNVENAKARLEAARKTFQAILERRKVDINAQWDEEKLYRWSRRWMEAAQAITDNKDGRIAAAEAHLKRMKNFEDLVKKMQSAGQASPEDVSAQEFFRLEAEHALIRAKGQ
jgi:hypothetical protein